MEEEKVLESGVAVGPEPHSVEANRYTLLKS
jgi:hypothetical protein